MSRYFMQLAYCGAPFHGWQRQPDESSVQQTIEDALATLLRRPIAITGAGRTDTGVNARMMVAHLDWPDDLPAPDDRTIYTLNHLCGREIAIYSLTPVASDAHARFDATERTYRYMAHRWPQPFVHALSWPMPASIDVEAMNEAAALLVGRRDFTSFSKLHTQTKTNICDLRHCAWHTVDGTGGRQLYLEIKADRFLRNMVRAVVGTLVEVGRHHIEPAQIMDIVERRDRSAAGTSMPAEALFLWDISYPYFTPDQHACLV